LAQRKEKKKMVKASSNNFNNIVDVLGNPIRRRIIRKLSEGPDYTLRLSNELNIAQQLATKHLKVIRNAELVDVFREKSNRGAEKKMFNLNKFYSLQIDFSPNLYNERLISFNNPNRWIYEDNYMERLEDKVVGLSEEESGVDKLSPLGQIVNAIDNELENIEKRRARLLYIRNLAMNASSTAMDELDRRKRQLIHYILDVGPTSITDLSKYLHIREETIKNLVNELVREDLVNQEGNIIYLKDLI
jgi:predicted transcriptional regulator